MSRPTDKPFLRKTSAKLATLLLISLGAAHGAGAQDTPLLSGGVGFFSSTTAGNSTYTPVLEPLAAVPVWSRLLLESRAILLEAFSPSGTQSGYEHSHFIGLTYLQGDYLASPHLTIVGGSYLIPFGTYNERLSPIWISNFQDGPLISSIGIMSTGTGVGGQLRGSAISRPGFSIDYAAWFSARDGNPQFSAERSSGGRLDLYLPRPRTAGFSRAPGKISMEPTSGGSRRIQTFACAPSSPAASTPTATGSKPITGPLPSAAWTASSAASSPSFACSKPFVSTTSPATVSPLSTPSAPTLDLITTCRTT
jgi:hypothetical protein